MFIKLHLEADDAFVVFRAEDIRSIEPVYCKENTVTAYQLILFGSVIGITEEQAHDLALSLNAVQIDHPSSYM